jgi:hypothetical protein
MHNKEKPVAWRRQLQFEDDELWMTLRNRFRSAVEVCGRNYWRVF